MCDISIRTEGPVAIIRGPSDAGKQWLCAHAGLEPWQVIDGGVYATNNERGAAILDGAIRDGLVVSLNGVEMDRAGAVEGTYA